MSLIGNYSVLNKSCGRFRSGATVSINRSNWNRLSDHKAFSIGEARVLNQSEKASVPMGQTPSTAVMAPLKAGALSSFSLATGTGSSTFAITGGRNGSATLVGSCSVSAVGKLTVLAAATLAGVGAISAASVLAVLPLSSTLAGTGSLTSTAKATGVLVLSVTGNGTLTSTIFATGELNADITPFTDLSPENLASAVWNALAAQFTTTGTMGDLVRVSNILLRNKVVTNPSNGTMTVYDVDGTTVLFTANLFEDAAGSQAYQGNGAERRERFE